MQWLKATRPIFTLLNVIFEQSANPESAAYLLLEETNLPITVKNVSAQLDGCVHSSLLHQFRLCKNVPHSRLPDKLILSLCPRLCGLALLSEYKDIHHEQKPHCMIAKLNNLTLPLPNNKKCIALLTDLELPLNSHPALPYTWVEHEKIGGGGYLSTFCICLLVCFLFRMGSVPACLGNPGYPLSASSRSDGPREYTKVSAFRLYLCPWL